MMMAELVQGQASVAQPGTKDDFADTIRRVRQVNVVKRPYVRSTNGVFVCVERGRTLIGDTADTLQTLLMLAG